MDDVNLDDDREGHWRMVFKDNDGGVDDAKELLCAKRWDVYMNEKGKLFKGGYLLEVVGCGEKKVLWEVADNNVVEEATDNYEIGLQEFNFYLFEEDEKGVGREGSSEFPYLLMSIKLCTGYCNTQLKRMNQKVD